MLDSVDGSAQGGRHGNDHRSSAADRRRAALLREWADLISQAAASSAMGVARRRRAILRRPWDAQETVAVTLDPDAPDFGIRFARAMAAACREGGVPWRRCLGLFRQLRGPLAWIRHAIVYQARAGEGEWDGLRHLAAAQRVVADAISLHEDQGRRALLSRLLVCHGAEPERVARALELDVTTVTAWQELFFAIGDRDRDPVRFFSALKIALEEDAAAVAGPDLPPLAGCACLDLDGAFQLCGFANLMQRPATRPAGKPRKQQDFDPAEAADFWTTWRALMLNPDAFELDAPQVKDVLAEMEKTRREHAAKWPSIPLEDEEFERAIKYVQDAARINAEAAYAELALNQEEVPNAPEVDGQQQADDAAEMTGHNESDPEESEAVDAKPPAAAEPLSTVEMRRLCELLGAGSAQRVKAPPTLKPLLRKPEQPARNALPPELYRPDCGHLLAQRLAGTGVVELLPQTAGSGFFHWVRMAVIAIEAEGAAEGDGGQAAGAAGCQTARQAIELHLRAASRLLLQTALLTLDAELQKVAELLKLEPQVVRAYATLFFNLRLLPGNTLRQAVVERIRMGRDPLDGRELPSPCGHADLLQAAPMLTLREFGMLAGFERMRLNSASGAACDLLDAIAELRRRRLRSQGQPSADLAALLPQPGLTKREFVEIIKRAARRGVSLLDEPLLAGLVPEYDPDFEYAVAYSNAAILNRLRMDAGELSWEDVVRAGLVDENLP